MKKLLTKRNILIVSVFYILTFGIILMFSSTCYDYQWCREDLWFFIETFSPLALVFLFSLITYKMRDEVFEHWMKFAVWGVPVMMILTYFILGGAGGGGYLGMGGAFDGLLLVLLYGTFCGISIWRIVGKYNELKHGEL